MKKSMLLSTLLLYFINASSQESQQSLLLQYLGEKESQVDQIEYKYIDYVLSTNNIVNITDAEKYIPEIHQFFIEHMDEILLSAKSNELLEWIEEQKAIKKEQKRALWGQVLGAVASGLAAAGPQMQAALAQQNEEYVEKQRKQDIQSFLASHSIKDSPKQYSQSFASNNEIYQQPIQQSRRVTTSNGFDEPTSGGSTNILNDYLDVNSGLRETSGTTNKGQTVFLRVRYDASRNCPVVCAYKITGVSYPSGNNWAPANVASISTSHQLDGVYARDYKWVSNMNGLQIYFNY